MKDGPSNSGGSTEPPRSKTIPDDFIWDEELQAWYAPGTPSDWDAAAWLRDFEESRKERGPVGLISREELLAAGALVTPEKKLKSMKVERDLFSGLFSEVDLEADNADSELSDGDDNESDDDAV